MSRRLCPVLRAAAILLFLVEGCATTKKPDKVTQELLSQPKEVLFEKGKVLIAKKDYEGGRKYLNFVFETYPNDPLGRQALLMVADSYYRQGGTSGYTEARFRYRDYLNRYPGSPQRDYARYQFAVCSDKENVGAERDQTSTREALEQYQALLREFPDSTYVTPARERIRRLVDILAEHDFKIGVFYMRKGASAAALGRFAAVEEGYPEFKARDRLFFYSAETLGRLGRREEASRYYQRVIDEFPDSPFARRARQRVAKIKSPESTSVDTTGKSE